jgi:hypothetical protein
VKDFVLTMCRHSASIFYHADSCDVFWLEEGDSNSAPPKMRSFNDSNEAWEFAVEKLRDLFWHTDLKDCAIDLCEICPECGRTPLDFVGWKSM